MAGMGLCFALPCLVCLAWLVCLLAWLPASWLAPGWLLALLLFLVLPEAWLPYIWLACLAPGWNWLFWLLKLFML